MPNHIDVTWAHYVPVVKAVWLLTLLCDREVSPGKGRDMPQIIPRLFSSPSILLHCSLILIFFDWLNGGWSPTGSTRHGVNWLAYCTCPGWLWWWRIWWNEDWQRKPKYSEKTRPRATLSTTNPTWPDPGSNAGRRCGKPATNRLSYGAAISFTYLLQWKTTILIFS
jgi:hypothetical protein